MIAVIALLAGLSAAAPGEQPAPGVRWAHHVRPGPVRVDVLTVDRVAGIRVLTGGDRVPGLERPSAMARRHDAIAGVNGGYFAGGAPDSGDPTGVVVADGRLLSEPVGARTALLVPRRGAARVAALRWRGSLRAGGATRLIDGVNRNRGRIPACGGRGGDRPTQRIDPALTCTDASELVLLTPAYGRRSPAGGAEAVVRDGVVVSVGAAQGVRVPAGGYVLSGSGDAARFLRRHLAPGDRPRLDLALATRRGRLDPRDYRAIVGGAPRLLRDGRIRIPADREGRGADTARNPRTIAGVRADGALLLITIDGRRPGWSVGATLREAARTARSLGAVDAVCLDSGGSTTMVVDGRVVNRPSEGERAVANGVFVLSSGSSSGRAAGRRR